MNLKQIILFLFAIVFVFGSNIDEQINSFYDQQIIEQQEENKIQDKQDFNSLELNNLILQNGDQYSEEINPGLEVQVTNESLNDLSQKIGNILQQKINHLQIPDIDTKVNGIKVQLSDGEISYFVISVNNFYFSQSEDGQTIIRYEILIQAIQIDFKYFVQKSVLVKFKDAGIVNLQEFKLIAEVQPLNQNGKLVIQPNNVEISLGKVNVDLGNSPLKFLASEALEVAIKQFLDGAFEKLQSTILKELELLGNIIPQQIGFKIEQQDINFNLDLVQDPYINENILFLKFNGAFYKDGEETYYLNPDTQFNAILESKATRIFIDQAVLNSLLNIVFNIKKDTHFQLNFPSGLGTTSTFNSMTMVSIFPKLKKFVPYKDWRQVSLKLDIKDIEINFDGPENNLVFLIKANSNIITYPAFQDQIQNQYHLQNQNMKNKKCQIKERSLLDQTINQLNKILGVQLFQENKNQKQQQEKQQDFENCHNNSFSDYENQFLENDGEIYAQNVETVLKLAFNIVQKEQQFGIQLVKFQIPTFKPSQFQIDENLFNMKQIDLALTYMESLILQAINGYYFNVQSINVEKILGTTLDEFGIQFFQNYCVILIDF